jgi:hypothetical protein
MKIELLDDKILIDDQTASEREVIDLLLELYRYVGFSEVVLLYPTSNERTHTVVASVDLDTATRVRELLTSLIKEQKDLAEYALVQATRGVPETRFGEDPNPAFWGCNSCGLLGDSVCDEDFDGEDDTGNSTLN